MSQIEPSNDPCQSDVLTFAEEHGDWFTSKVASEKLNISSREVAAKFLRKLWKYKFLERRKKHESAELEYKIII